MQFINMQNYETTGQEKVHPTKSVVEVLLHL